MGSVVLVTIVGKMILVRKRFEHKTSEHKTNASASSKRVLQLFLEILSSYVVVFQDGERHNVIRIIRLNKR